jgi:hypothetical protein
METATNIGVMKVDYILVNQTKKHVVDAEKEEGCEENEVDSTAVKNVGMMTAMDNENIINVSILY